LLLSPRCIGVGSRLGQLRFTLGECCLGSSSSATKSTALGLSTGLGYVDPLCSGVEHDGRGWNQRGPPQDRFQSSTGSPSCFGERWDERSGQCDHWRGDHKVGDGSFELKGKLEGPVTAKARTRQTYDRCRCPVEVVVGHSLEPLSSRGNNKAGVSCDST